MNHQRVYFLICVASFVSKVGSGLTRPLLPLFARELGASIELIGMTVSGFWITRAFVEVPSGYVSDKIGHKTPIILGLFLSGISSFLSALSRDPYQLILARGLDGLGSTLFLCTATALTVEILGAQSRGRSFSTWMGTVWGGVLIGTLMSGYIADLWGFRANFHICGIFMLIGGGMIAFSPSPRHLEAQNRRRPRRGRVSWALVISPSLALLFLMGVMRILVEQGIVDTILPIYARDHLHLDVVLIGTLIAVRSMGHIAMTVLAGFLSDRVGRKPVLLTGLAVISLSVFLLSAVSAFQLLVPLMFLLGSGSGILESVLPVLVSELADPSVRGLAIGIFRTAFDIGGTIGPILMTSVFNSLGVHYCFYLAATLIFINLPLVFPLRKRET